MRYVKLYDGKDYFKPCKCKDSEKFCYCIKHEIKPLSLGKELQETIEYLLWYSPNIEASEQSFDNFYLRKREYEDMVIQYLLEYCFNISVEDICFVEDFRLPYKYIKPYEEKVCFKCQKIVVTQDVREEINESKFMSIFRHIRNCLAHGNFNVIDGNRIIGFDKRINKMTGKASITAIIQLDIDRLHRFAKQLIAYPDFTISRIFYYAMLKAGYIVELLLGEDNEELVFAERDRRIVVNFSRYLSASIEDIKTHILNMKNSSSKEEDYIEIFLCEKCHGDMIKMKDTTYLMSIDIFDKVIQGDDISLYLF